MKDWNMKHSEKSLNARQIICRRRQAIETKREYLRLLLRIISFAVILYFVFSKIFMITQVKGNLMFPAVKDGDLLLTYRLQSDYSKNDVVAYDMGGGLKIGRIVALENDVVTIDESGVLLVNGTVQEGEILFATYPGEILEYPYTVPEGCIFILSDNRAMGNDSRFIGAVLKNCVEGKVIFILRKRGI